MWWVCVDILSDSSPIDGIETDLPLLDAALLTAVKKRVQLPHLDSDVQGNIFVFN